MAKLVINKKEQLFHIGDNFFNTESELRKKGLGATKNAKFTRTTTGLGNIHSIIKTVKK